MTNPPAPPPGPLQVLKSTTLKFKKQLFPLLYFIGERPGKRFRGFHTWDSQNNFPKGESHFSPPFKNNNHRNIKLEKQEFRKAWQRYLVVPIDANALIRILGFKKATPLPPYAIFPLFHYNNHRNIKLQKHVIGTAWHRVLVVPIDGEALIRILGFKNAPPFPPYAFFAPFAQK